MVAVYLCAASLVRGLYMAQYYDTRIYHHYDLLGRTEQNRYRACTTTSPLILDRLDI